MTIWRGMLVSSFGLKFRHILLFWVAENRIVLFVKINVIFFLGGRGH